RYRHQSASRKRIAADSGDHDAKGDEKEESIEKMLQLVLQPFLRADNADDGRPAEKGERTTENARTDGARELNGTRAESLVWRSGRHVRQVDRQVFGVCVEKPVVEAPDFEPPPVAGRFERGRRVTRNQLALLACRLHELVGDFVVGFQLPIDLAVET